MKQLYTIREIAESTLLDHIFLKEKTTYNSKYQRIWKMVKSGELKFKRIGGITRIYRRIHIDDIKKI